MTFTANWVCTNCGRYCNEVYNEVYSICWNCKTTRSESNHMLELQRASRADPRPIAVHGEFGNVAMTDNLRAWENTPAGAVPATAPAPLWADVEVPELAKLSPVKFAEYLRDNGLVRKMHHKAQGFTVNADLGEAVASSSPQRYADDTSLGDKFERAGRALDAYAAKPVKPQPSLYNRVFFPQPGDTEGQVMRKGSLYALVHGILIIGVCYVLSEVFRISFLGHW
jgi:hypothetical protein